MNIAALKNRLDSENTGQDLYGFIKLLYPICRSITGDGFRETLSIIERHVQLDVHEIPTGTEVFDWTIPKEWNIRDAYIKNSAGERIVDFKKSNLHVVGYSAPISKKMSYAELKPHLFTLPDHPSWIPYRTSYYNEVWGFCLSHERFLKLDDGEYEVFIDSTLNDGVLNYGECYLPGEQQDEILISCHACHPSLCNDNLSGVAIATFLAKYLGQVARRYSYRFVFIPGTIGSIAWLSRNKAIMGRIKHGLVLTCLGDSGKSTYKKSRRGEAEIDKAAMQVLRHSGSEYRVEEFFPYGYDERQYCSPGFDLPVGCLMRSPHGSFSEYHTSADNLEFVRAEYLFDSLFKCLGILNLLEANETFVNTNPKCEPQLGKRGLYKEIGGQAQQGVDQMALLWVLNLSDGEHTLLDIAERSGMDFDLIQHAAEVLLQYELLRKTEKGAA